MSESGAQLFARLEARRCLKEIEPRLFPDDGGPDPGELVEVYGPEGTGKTELLYHLLCRCVLPEAAGGLEVDVVFVDTDYSLDMFRLVSILDHRLNAGVSTRSEDAVRRSEDEVRLSEDEVRRSEDAVRRSEDEVRRSEDEVRRSEDAVRRSEDAVRRSPGLSAGSEDAALRSCLSRLSVVNCCSSSQLLLTLHFLATTLSSRPSVALLLIDSISAFYWLDRGEGGASAGQQEDKFSRCSELLARLLRDYRITVFAACHSIRRNPGGPPSSSEQDRSHLGRSWQRLVSHRLICSRPDSGGGGVSQVFSVCCSSGSKGSRVSSFRVTDGGLDLTSDLPPPAAPACNDRPQPL